jgi:hypothetical protein
VARMAGRPGFPETSPGADRGQSRDVSRSGGRPAVRGTNAVIENWLQLHLRQLYEEVCSEPLPSELSEMIDRFRMRRQDSETGRDTVASLPPQARQGS